MNALVRSVTFDRVDSECVRLPGLTFEALYGVIPARHTDLLTGALVRCAVRDAVVDAIKCGVK